MKREHSEPAPPGWDADILYDPELRRRGLEWAKVNQERRKRDVESATPVIAELRRAGFDIDGIGDLRQLSKREYQRAIPVLFKWLERTGWIGLKEGIARTLASPWARPIAARPLIEAFLSIDHALQDEDQGPERYQGVVKWTIGHALKVVADDSVFDEIVGLIRDHRHGKTRGMPTEALCNMKDPRAVDVLIEMLDDDDVAVNAAAALGKLKASKARRYLQSLLQDRRTAVRREAKRALTKIDKSEQRAASRTPLS